MRETRRSSQSGLKNGWKQRMEIVVVAFESFFFKAWKIQTDQVIGLINM